MLKKLVLGVAVMAMSAIAMGATLVENKPVEEFPLDYDPYAYVIGYKELVKGSGFPASISEISRGFGKRPEVDVAIPQGVSIQEKDNIKVKIVDKVIIYTIPTKDSRLVSFNSDKYKVTYTVGAGYFYGAEVVFKYDPKYSIDEQDAFLNDKVRRFLEYNGFVEVKKWMGMVKNNMYTRGDITVVVISDNTTRNNGVVVTIYDEEINKEVGALFDNNINKEIKERFKEVDHFLK